MCGIVGVSLSEPQAEASEFVAGMTSSIRHRGPDSDGVFRCRSGTTYLGFRRLAIRDLDCRANQPMRSASGRTVIAFNGEIYNTAELAPRFCSHRNLRTTGDTEVFLEAFEKQGETILPDCNGMFAVSFYDEGTQTLTLARDRMGKKPLYLYEGDNFLAFASELRAFDPLGLEPDPERMPFYFQFGYMPSPYAFFKRTSQVCPGEVLKVRRGRIVSRRRYHEHADLCWGSQQEIELDVLDRQLADTVAIRTLSDVPVGAFLSGGIDSALVVAQLRAAGRLDIPTYTVAFSDPRYNEAPFAAQVARRLGLPHTEIPIDEKKLPDLVTDFLDCYEQPYIDSSGMPSMLLCREVKKYVSVALCGDGGDEFFGGYERYDWYRQALLAQRLPSLARRLLRRLTPLIDRRRGRRIQRLLETNDAAGLYAGILRCWTVGTTSELLPDVPAADDPPVQLVRDLFARMNCDPLSKAACFDASYYIPDDLQVKMDRASLRVALEVRSPLLDFRVTELGARLATRVKYRAGKKSILKKLLARHLPPRLFQRPKQGFAIPMATWLRGPLHKTVHDVLFSQRLRECGWLDFTRVEFIWEQFHRGRSEFAGPLWMLFVLSMTLCRMRSAECGVRNAECGMWSPKDSVGNRQSSIVNHQSQRAA